MAFEICDYVVSVMREVKFDPSRTLTEPWSMYVAQEAPSAVAE